MPNIHDYPVTVSWEGGRGGSGAVETQDGHVACGLAVPEEFQGPGGGGSPEQLLTCAVASCYAITFGIIAERQRLPVESLTVEAVGRVDASSMLPRYTSVEIRARIRAASPTDEQKSKIHEMAQKAEGYCIVTNTLRDKVEIRVESEIEGSDRGEV